MSKVIVLSDTRNQKKGLMQAKDLFKGTFFKKTYEYASLLNPDYLFIMTAKYGIVSYHDIISSYNLDVLDIDEIGLTNNFLKTIRTLIRNTNLVEDEFLLLCKDRYTKLITPWLNNYRIPLGKLDKRGKIDMLNKLIIKEKTKQENYKYLKNVERVV